MTVGARAVALAAMASLAQWGCGGGGGDAADTERVGLPPGLPPPDATRPARVAEPLPATGRQPLSSTRVSTLIGHRTHNVRPTVVTFLPPGWRADGTPRDPALPKTTGASFPPIPPRLATGDDADVAFYGPERTILLTQCDSRTTLSQASARPAGIDDPTGEVAARVAAANLNAGVGVVTPPTGRLPAPTSPPRLAPRVYRAGYVVAVGFPGGGCLLLGDPEYAAMPTRYLSPEQEWARLQRARQRPFPRDLIMIAKRTTGHWGVDPSQPASNLRAEAIARRARRAVMTAPQLLYVERWGYCVGYDAKCKKSEEPYDRRVVEHDRASGYTNAELSPRSWGTTRIIGGFGGNWYSDVRSCWTREAFPGALANSSDVFLLEGPWASDQRAAFFPPVRRPRLSYEPPRSAGSGITRLEWSSYFDRGTALVDDKTLRLLSVDRIHAFMLQRHRQRILFEYPSELKRERPEPRCSAK